MNKKRKKLLEEEKVNIGVRLGRLFALRKGDRIEQFTDFYVDMLNFVISEIERFEAK